jgi:hypothetical protein
MCRQPHTYAVDYFAVGVLAYEFMLGRVNKINKANKNLMNMIFFFFKIKK